MIIVKIHSGLGNQLFEYACARNLAIKYNKEIKFDITALKGQEEYYNCSIYRLHHYNVIENVLDEKDAQLFYRKEYSGIFYKIFRKLSNKKIFLYKNNKFEVNDGDFHVHQKKLFKNGSIYLNGYFGDAKFFRENNAIISKELTLKLPINEVNQEFKTQMLNCNSVGIHIRRGDYAKNNHFFNILDKDYYKSAIDYIRQFHTDCHFYIFSDNLSEAKEIIGYTLNENEFTLVTTNSPLEGFVSSETDYMELELMRSCKHFIIANSTFSWWGAWLIENPKKIIVAPKKWFNAKEEQKLYEAGKLVPSEWIKV